MPSRPCPKFWSLLLLWFVASAHADPWIPPGDERLRHDIQTLADAGVLRGPVTTWPLSWPDIARDVLSADEKSLDPASIAALSRVRRLARDASGRGFQGLGIRASAAQEPGRFRWFADTPREEGELALRASWLSDHIALNLQGAYVLDPSDGKQLRLDGSYLGVNVGNFMLSAGLMERWWGPGWDGSLILSTNARPIPGITLERNYTDPFSTKLLSWLGPWRASIAVGQAEGHRVELPDVRFLAARVNFKPRPWMEFGLTRTAQWCGGDRVCDWSTFADLLVGRDNQVDEGGNTEEQPGNQLAGYDLRIRSPWPALPVAVYGQLIGEDEAGGLPAKFLGMAGLEIWGGSRFGNWRLRAEYAGTACNFSREQPLLDCAYRNTNYPQGYSYRGRIIGHTLDNDRRMLSVAGTLVADRGQLLSLALRRIEPYPGDIENGIGGQPVGVDNVELRYSHAVGGGNIQLGVGYTEPGLAPGTSSRVQGFVTWQQGF